jgi:DcuC family C4-dicarboxylate transporter
MTIPMMLALLTTIWTAWMILNGSKPQTVLMLSGLLLMTAALVLIPGLDFVSDKSLTQSQSTQSKWFDLFAYIRQIFSSRVAGLGLTIMAIAGFAKYMDHIGASRALVFIAVKPLSVLKSPYLVLSLGLVVGQLLAIVISSASGLGLLLMLTMYPILTRLGVSPLAATAMIGTTQCLDLGPASGNSNLAAKTAGLDIIPYFILHQGPVAICVVLTVAALHFFVQRSFDRRMGHVVNEIPHIEHTEAKDEDAPPKLYALLPLIPLVLLITFSSLFKMPYSLDIVTAMLMCVAICLVCEFIRLRDAKRVFGSLQVFFDGLGVQFATVITLIVAGEVFANGLKMTGSINGLIDGAKSLGLGGGVFIVVMTAIITVAAIVMGSGNAPFFAFAGLVPDVASSVGVSAVSMILPMQFASSIARSVSPITAVIVAVAGVANVSPVDVVKRTAIPMAGGMAANLAASAVFL